MIATEKRTGQQHERKQDKRYLPSVGCSSKYISNKKLEVCIKNAKIKKRTIMAKINFGAKNEKKKKKEKKF